MKKLRAKKFLYYLIPIIISTIITAIGNFMINGIPLIGVPEVEDVAYVEISNNRLDTKGRRLTDTADIEKAVDLTNFLLWKLGAPQQKEPVIEFVFHLKDGNSYVIGATENTFYNNGKAYSLKGDTGITFIKITEGIFFFD